MVLDTNSKSLALVIAALQKTKNKVARLKALAEVAPVSRAAFLHAQGIIDNDRKNRNATYDSFAEAQSRAEPQAFTSSSLWYGNGDKLAKLFENLSPKFFNVGDYKCSYFYQKATETDDMERTSFIALLVERRDGVVIAGAVLTQYKSGANVLRISNNGEENEETASPNSEGDWEISASFPWTHVQIMHFIRGEKLEELVKIIMKHKEPEMFFPTIIDRRLTTSEYAYHSDATQGTMRMEFGKTAIEYKDGAHFKSIRVYENKNSKYLYMGMHMDIFYSEYTYTVSPNFPWTLNEVLDDFLGARDLPGFKRIFYNNKVPTLLFTLSDNWSSNGYLYKANFPTFELTNHGNRFGIICNVIEETEINVYIVNKDTDYYCDLVFMPDRVIVKPKTNGMTCISANDVADIIIGNGESMYRVLKRVKDALPMKRERSNRKVVQTPGIRELRNLIHRKPNQV
jgi:hypothetical protein